MTTKEIILYALITSGLTFVITVLVTLLWNLFIDNKGAIVDWKTSFLFAIIMGIVLPIVKARDNTN